MSAEEPEEDCRRKIACVFKGFEGVALSGSGKTADDDQIKRGHEDASTVARGIDQDNLPFRQSLQHLNRPDSAFTNINRPSFDPLNVSQPPPRA